MDKPSYIITLDIYGKGEWPYGFDTIEEAAVQAHAWCDEALNSPNPEHYQITFALATREKSND